MAIELMCRGCGQYFTPSKSDILSGRYRLCEQCRDEQPPATATHPITGTAAAR